MSDGSITKSKKTSKRKRHIRTDIEVTRESSFSHETISSQTQTFSSSASEGKKNVSYSLKDDDSSLFTSTPKRVQSNHGCEEHHDDHSGKGLRVRGKDCNRVHYTCDMDDSNLSQYEGKKRQKRRLTLLDSLSIDHDEREELHLDTLENHLFTDISYWKSDLAYNDESKFTSSKEANTSWSKLHGVSYSSKFDFSEDNLCSFSHCINHPCRSDFRQKKRIWYLNRRNRSSSYHVESFWQRCIRNIFHILSFASIFMHNVSRKINRRLYILYYYTSKISTHVFTRFIYRPLHSILYLYTYIYNFWKTKVISVYSKFTSLFIRSSSSDKETITYQAVDDKSKSGFPWCFCILFWLFIALALYINFSHRIIAIPDPTERGIANAYPLFIDAKNSKIPAWHIHPVRSTFPTHPLNKSFEDKTPVILYLRNSGNADTPHLKNVYKTLSSLGYHLIVPTNILSQTEVLPTWKWIKMQTNSIVYMWGYDINSATLSEYAKRFCKDLIPPTGVIIAKELKIEISHRNLEIWSCNCTLAPNGISNGTDYKYNHVKCPITFSNTEDVYSQVVSCIETVNKNVK